MKVLEIGIDAIERGLVPDAVTRAAVRSLCRTRLRTLRKDGGSSSVERFRNSLCTGPIALVPDKANQQHYELPPEFFGWLLGSRRKYSCCWWPDASTTLDEAEHAALEATSDRAQIGRGQDILELGCGWGSLSLWIAEKYPTSRITAVSNSASQRQFIEATALERKLTNLRVITADMNHFEPSHAHSTVAKFDRIVSVEMFEHMRNYEQLLRRIASWLRPGGTLFVHVFCHRDLAYPFESDGASNWMGRHFFTGGLMPSAGLLSSFSRDLEVTQRWTWNGRHYQRTAEAWLNNLDARRAELLSILASVYGAPHAQRWLNRWRMFFLAVAELFGFRRGEEWFVAHYLMEHADRHAAAQTAIQPARQPAANLPP